MTKSKKKIIKKKRTIKKKIIGGANELQHLSCFEHVPAGYNILTEEVKGFYSCVCIRFQAELNLVKDYYTFIIRNRSDHIKPQYPDYFKTIYEFFNTLETIHEKGINTSSSSALGLGRALHTRSLFDMKQFPGNLPGEVRRLITSFLTSSEIMMCTASRFGTRQVNSNARRQVLIDHVIEFLDREIAHRTTSFESNYQDLVDLQNLHLRNIITKGYIFCVSIHNETKRRELLDSLQINGPLIKLYTLYKNYLEDKINPTISWTSLKPSVDNDNDNDNDNENDMSSQSSL